MHRDDVVKVVREKLEELGVGKHLTSIQKISAKVHVDVLIGPGAKRLELRSGITRIELEHKLQELASAWHLHSDGQMDVEGVAQ